MRQIIRRIIREVPRGCIFDSHFVIARVIKLDPNAYLRFVCRFNARTITANRVHGQMAQEITRFVAEGVVERLGESWSEDVKGEPNKCACWRKLRHGL